MATLTGTGSNDWFLSGTPEDDTIYGLGGSDSLWGEGGNDVLYGDDGNDWLDATEGDDILVGEDGDDHFRSLAGSGADAMLGGEGDDHFLEHWAEGDSLYGGAGIDTVAFSNIVVASGVVVDLATHSVSGALGNATLSGVENVEGSRQADLIAANAKANALWGDFGNDSLDGRGGNDTLKGNAGNDVLTGGRGADVFSFSQAGGSTADFLTDFTSGVDQLNFDARFLANLGTTGRLAVGDPRFHAAAGATSGHDGDDRFVYDTTARALYFDADGSGSGPARLVATLQGGATLVATDLVIKFGSAPPMRVNGTAASDTLAGDSGDDTLEGLGGDDSLLGGAGADALSGGDGNDTVNGLDHRIDEADPERETLAGGLGDDLLLIDNGHDVVSDAGGNDTISAHNINWTLGPGFENLSLYSGEYGSVGRGNGLANHISLSYSPGRVEGRGGDDTIVGGWFGVRFYGGGGDDSLVGSNGRVDWLDGGVGNDTLDGSWDDDPAAGAAFVLSASPGAANADLIVDFAAEAGDMIRIDGRAMPEIGASGRFLADDGRFYASAGASAGHDADDRIIYDTTTGRLFYDADGNGPRAALLLATLQGAPELTGSQVAVDNGTPGQTVDGTSGEDRLLGSAGGDTMNGLAGSDTLVGGAGDDVISDSDGNARVNGGIGHDAISLGNGNATVSGGRGNDVITDTGGTDRFVFDVDPGVANWDQIYGFAGDKIVLRLDVFDAVGPAGDFSVGDGRFYAESMAWTGVNGHDADDRMIYNTNNGDLWYDADGSGPGEAQLIANLRGPDGITPATLLASDIWVM